MKKITFLLALFAVFQFCYGGYSLEYTGKRTKLFFHGQTVDFARCFREQLQRYPESGIRDWVKLAYQAAWGPAHGIADRARAWKYFSREFAAAEADKTLALFEVISPDYCRVNLGAWKAAGLPGKWLFNMFCVSAEILPDSQKLFNEYIRQMGILLGEKRGELDNFMRKYRGGAVHHTPLYRHKYRPSYRLVSIRFITALPVLKAAAKLPEKNVSVIAVDGRAASGKTTLARQLALILDTTPVHMDDFFLPIELRTPGRLTEAGGNVHYERFKAEVLPRLKHNAAFAYQRFDCSKMQPGEMRHITASRWRIVEGAYCLHPTFGDYADLKVFFDIKPEQQLQRIRKRNGERMAENFVKRWIPMEEKYIKTFNIKMKADIILGTDLKDRQK
jgi:uridine kinase